MPVTGTLETMPLSELLQWLGQNKTGTLELQHDKLLKTLWIEGGRIAGFGSNDPPSLLGQFLLARGKIDEQTLNKALKIQEERRETLGRILIEMEAIGEVELNRYVQAKAEEALLKMFEWDNASFNFNHNGRREPHLVEMDLGIENLLTQGENRRDEMEKMKQTLGDHGTVLCRTETPLNKETANTTVAKRIYELVDGKRSFGEILLLSRASEYLVTKFLYELSRAGIIRVVASQESSPTPGTSDECCQLADDLVASGEYEAAMDILSYALAGRSGDSLLDKKLGVVESIFLNHVYSELIPPRHVPVALRNTDAITPADGLKPSEYYLLSLVDEHDWNVETLVRLAPMYEIEVMRGLKKLLSKEIIGLQEDGGEASNGQTERQIDEALGNLVDTEQAAMQIDQKG
jgi:hypothetical protein